MASVVDICNQALSHLGIGKEIASLETERSEEASALRRFYEASRDEVLRDFPWPFATRQVELGLVATDPTDEWSYSYRYPSDCLMLRRLVSGLRPETAADRVPYRVMGDSTAGLIYTDQENAVAEYTARVTDASVWPVDFRAALSYLLAARIGVRLGASAEVAKVIQLYQYEINKARANAANEEQPDVAPDSEFISFRG